MSTLNEYTLPIFETNDDSENNKRSFGGSVRMIFFLQKNIRNQLHRNSRSIDSDRNWIKMFVSKIVCFDFWQWKKIQHFFFEHRDFFAYNNKIVAITVDVIISSAAGPYLATPLQPSVLHVSQNCVRRFVAAGGA